MTKSTTPNQYAAEYEFRGDGGDYTPTDGERTMIEDAILGYLGQFDEPTSVKRPLIDIEFSPPFSYVSIPLDADGQGPADEVDAVSTTHEVWDANCFTVATCGSEETARKIAELLNRSSISSAKEANAERALIEKIAQIANSVGWQAGEPAMELAGQIVSILAANPEHIERFMQEGAELFLDGTFNPENGSLTYRAMNGQILSPSTLREQKGMQQ